MSYCIRQEKEEEDLPSLRIALMHQYKYLEDNIKMSKESDMSEANDINGNISMKLKPTQTRKQIC